MRRRLIQIISAFVANSYLPSLFTKGIYQGNLKGFCIPILNCYSCPLATFACPIGSLQHFFASVRANLAVGSYQFGLYVIGILGIVSSAVGRMACGWVCPFGLLQELLYKIRSPKLAIPRFLPHFKYVFLAITVVLLPILAVDDFGYGQTWFCKWICPAGTLEAGIPLVALNESIRQQIGYLFGFKTALLILFLGWMVLSKRPFCRTVCPLGAIFSLFNRVSIFQLVIHQDKCVRCDACYRACPTDIKVYEDANSPDCVRCLRCIKACEFDAVGYEITPIDNLQFKRGI